MTIIAGMIAISKQSINRAMQKVRELTPRGTHLPLEQSVKTINQWYVGWASYYSMTQYPSQLKKIDAHTRRRLRSRLIGQQKKKRNLFKKVIKRKVSKRLAAKTIFSNKGRWALSHSMAIERAYPNRFFIGELKLKIRSNMKLAHWFDVQKWIKVT